MKPNQRIAFIAVAAIAIVAGWSAREERRSPCASGACRLPLLPADRKGMAATSTAPVAPTNATPPQTTGESVTKP